MSLYRQTQRLGSTPSVGSCLSGIEFNEIYKGIRFYKFLNRDFIHSDFRASLYKEGICIDPIPFNPSGSCTLGGLYFCSYYEKALLSEITIPDDAIVYVEENKFKANKLMVNKITEFQEMPQEGKE